MKKHGIKRDVSSIPPGEEEKLRGKPSNESFLFFLLLRLPSLNFFLTPHLHHPAFLPRSGIVDIQFRTEIPEGDAIKLWTIFGYNGLGDSEVTDDVFPHELGDILVFDASVCFGFHPFTEVICGDEQEFSFGRVRLVRVLLCPYPTARRARDLKLVSASPTAYVGPVKDRLYKCPPIKVKRAACTRILCAFLGSSGRVPVWRYPIMSFVHLGRLFGFASMTRSLKTDRVRARSNPDRMALYSASLLEAGNPSQMACSKCSPVGDCSRSPTPNPDDREAPSTRKVHHSCSSSSLR
ncbi:hypothetical protein CK203_060954 [Vitis vinifera]|uniref:Uncharacterized protein n=1 Tax=Vitis vinifera TaxID=29760 RepID=A0A438G978_VITVI|nr:hypothetical protein CK203_060954 [Vitis vinifera]